MTVGTGVTAERVRGSSYGCETVIYPSETLCGESSVCLLRDTAQEQLVDDRDVESFILFEGIMPVCADAGLVRNENAFTVGLVTHRVVLDVVKEHREDVRV